MRDRRGSWVLPSLLAVTLPSACVGTRARVIGVAPGESTGLQPPSVWHPQLEPPPQVCTTFELHALAAAPEIQPTARTEDGLPVPVRVGDWTVAASRDERGQVLLQAEADGRTIGPTPIIGELPAFLAMVPDGDTLVLAYTVYRRLLYARWQPSTGMFVHAPSLVVDDLPICKPYPRVTDAVVHEGITYVAVAASALGQHGPCAGYDRKTTHLSATIAIARNGLATEPMRHPIADADARLDVVGGEVVGRQQSWLGERTAGFRVRCASAP